MVSSNTIIASLSHSTPKSMFGQKFLDIWVLNEFHSVCHYKNHSYSNKNKNWPFWIGHSLIQAASGCVEGKLVFYPSRPYKKAATTPVKRATPEIRQTTRTLFLDSRSRSFSQVVSLVIREVNLCIADSGGMSELLRFEWPDLVVVAIIHHA